MTATSALLFQCRRRHWNSFLLIAVDRAKLLPFGSTLDTDELARVRDAVRLGLRFAAVHRTLLLDPAARERWIAI